MRIRNFVTVVSALTLLAVMSLGMAGEGAQEAQGDGKEGDDQKGGAKDDGGPEPTMTEYQCIMQWKCYAENESEPIANGWASPGISTDGPEKACEYAKLNCETEALMMCDEMMGHTIHICEEVDDNCSVEDLPIKTSTQVKVAFQQLGQQTIRLHVPIQAMVDKPDWRCTVSAIALDGHRIRAQQLDKQSSEARKKALATFNHRIAAHGGAISQPKVRLVKVHFCRCQIGVTWIDEDENTHFEQDVDGIGVTREAATNQARAVARKLVKFLEDQGHDATVKADARVRMVANEPILETDGAVVCRHRCTTVDGPVIFVTRLSKSRSHACAEASVVARAKADEFGGAELCEDLPAVGGPELAPGAKRGGCEGCGQPKPPKAPSPSP